MKYKLSQGFFTSGQVVSMLCLEINWFIGIQHVSNFKKFVIEHFLKTNLTKTPIHD